MTGVTLDAGGLIALERGDRRLLVLLELAAAGQAVVTSDPDDLHHLDAGLQLVAV